MIYSRGHNAGYAKAQEELTVEWMALLAEIEQIHGNLTRPLDHYDHQRAAGRMGTQ